MHPSPLPVIAFLAPLVASVAPGCLESDGFAPAESLIEISAYNQTDRWVNGTARVAYLVEGKPSENMSREIAVAPNSFAEVHRFRHIDAGTLLLGITLSNGTVAQQAFPGLKPDESANAYFVELVPDRVYFSSGFVD